MTLITKALTEQLRANGRAQRATINKGDEALDFKPVVELFVFFVLPGCSSLLLSPGGGKSAARLRVASRPSAVATSVWQDAHCTWLLADQKRQDPF